MDPNQAYLDMFGAMQGGDHETARELALALVEWFDKGGYTPYQYTRKAMMSYALSVLRRTRYLPM